MKKYVTFVKDEEESRQVQEALFRAGFKWLDGGGVQHTKHNRFIFIGGVVSGTDCSGRIHRVSDEEYTKVMGRVKAGDFTPINANSIISNPFQLDGATPPEKMITVAGKEYSESTIKAALQEYVK